MLDNDLVPVSVDLVAVAVRSLHAMADGEREEFGALYHPLAVDGENVVQPPASRVPGPGGVWATAQWLRAALADMRYDVHDTVATGNLVAVRSTMHGRHVAPWAFYAPDGTIDSVFPPTNRTFAATQSHWFQFEDGKIIEHQANRDDLGTGRQLGWIPPTPLYLIKMARAKRQAMRSQH